MFKISSKYLDLVLKTIDKSVDMVSQIYHPALQLNKANTFDTEATFLDLHLSIPNVIVSTKVYDKRDDFDLKSSISHF